VRESFFGFHGAEKVLNFECVIWVGTLELCVCALRLPLSHTVASTLPVTVLSMFPGNTVALHKLTSYDE